MSASRWKCRECGHICTDDEILKEHHPFKDGDLIWGCPSCLNAECLERACEVEGCERLASCGWPGEDGEYHHTCGEHDRSFQKDVAVSSADLEARLIVQSIENVTLR